MSRECGTGQQAACRCPYCEEALEERSPFCQLCGAAIRRCPGCGRVLTEGEDVCPQCGAEAQSGPTRHCRRDDAQNEPAE